MLSALLEWYLIIVNVFTIHGRMRYRRWRHDFHIFPCFGHVVLDLSFLSAHLAPLGTRLGIQRLHLTSNRTDARVFVRQETTKGDAVLARNDHGRVHTAFQISKRLAVGEFCRTEAGACFA